MIKQWLMVSGQHAWALNSGLGFSKDDASIHGAIERESVQIVHDHFTSAD